MHGGPRSECGDTKKDWYPQREVCVVAMQRAAMEARYDDLHREQPYHDGTFTHWTEKRTSRTPFHYRDGVKLWLSDRDLTPDDDFLSQG